MWPRVQGWYVSRAEKIEFKKKTRLFLPSVLPLMARFVFVPLNVSEQALTVFLAEGETSLRVFKFCFDIGIAKSDS